MAYIDQSFSNLTANGSDTTIGTLSKLPAIPSNAVLDSVVLNFNARRDGGYTNDSGKVSVVVSGNTITAKSGISRNKDYSNISVTLTSYVTNNNGVLSYTDGTTSLSIRGYHDYYIFGQSDWTISSIYIRANYTIPTYTLTINAGTGGTVTGGGTYNNQATATLSATPNSGYRFKQWSDGNTSATRTVTVTGNATYTAYFEPIYILYDSIFSFKRWANNNLTSWDLITISNVTDTGFTGTAKVDDAYTTECRPLIPVEAGKAYTFECTASGGGFEFFVFNCESSGAWSDFTYGNTQSFNFTPTKSYISIRCDVVGTGTVVNFSNFRIYPADCPYMSSSVSASERTDVSSWSMPTPTREGYTFKGWNTKPDGSGTTYTSSSAFPSNDLVLYSQWEEVKLEIKNVQMIYLDKQISATNKVPCGEGFVISVELS